MGHKPMPIPFANAPVPSDSRVKSKSRLHQYLQISISNPVKPQTVYSTCLLPACYRNMSHDGFYLTQWNVMNLSWLLLCKSKWNMYVQCLNTATKV